MYLNETVTGRNCGKENFYPHTSHKEKYLLSEISRRKIYAESSHGQYINMNTNTNINTNKALKTLIQ